MTTPHESTLQRFEEALVDRAESWYELTLIISGASQLSARAIANSRQFCESYLAGRYHLSIVDLHEDPASVLNLQVLAAPTLVKNQPLPVQKFVGDLSNTAKVRAAFGLGDPTNPDKSPGD